MPADHDLLWQAALEDVCTARADQISKHGHTPESDAQLPVRQLAAEVHDRAQGVLDELTGNPAPDRLAIAYRRMIRTAAVAIAAAERINLEIIKSEEPLP
jgi:hypothetical protein